LLTLVRDDLASDLDADAAPEELLDHVVTVAARVVPGADDASIAVSADDALQTIAAAGDTAIAADQAQRELGLGPSQLAIAERRTVHIPDLIADPDWTDLGGLVSRLGVRAVLACPLPMSRTRGVMTLYGSQPAAFDAAVELVAPVFAARAAIATAYANNVSQLQRAIRSRQVIGQAVGVLMERHRLSPEQAFDTMVNASQTSHLKLRELAQRITETGQDPDAAATDGR
jgi:GAF domain-containing protein